MRGLNKAIIRVFIITELGDRYMGTYYTILSPLYMFENFHSKRFKNESLEWPPRYSVKTKTRSRTCRWYAINLIRKKLNERLWIFAYISQNIAEKILKTLITLGISLLVSG